jgi:hypothetical protein
LVAIAWPAIRTAPFQEAAMGFPDRIERTDVELAEPVDHLDAA